MSLTPIYLVPLYTSNDARHMETILHKWSSDLAEMCRSSQHSTDLNQNETNKIFQRLISVIEASAGTIHTLRTTWTPPASGAVVDLNHKLVPAVMYDP